MYQVKSKDKESIGVEVLARASNPFDLITWLRDITLDELPDVSEGHTLTIEKETEGGAWEVIIEVTITEMKESPFGL